MVTSHSKLLLFCFVLSLVPGSYQQCESTLSTVSGRMAPSERLCKNKLLFVENFDQLDFNTWTHEVNMEGGNNGEFQWYTSNPRNAFVRNGILSIKPTLTTDVISDLTTCHIQLNNCSTVCERQCSADHIAPPIQSARLVSADGFAFKYGRVEIRAKLPTGDWLWPSIRLLPYKSLYGAWPRSGEIDLMEARGNWDLVENNVQIGPEQFSSNLRFGSEKWNIAWKSPNISRNTAPGQGLNRGYHLYQMEWAPTHLSFRLDNNWIATIHTDDIYFKRGNFNDSNPWLNGNRNAPFDQKFYFVLDLAVGGINGFFPEKGNREEKPWRNDAQFAARDFWNGREQWLDTWNFDENSEFGSSFQIDYIKVSAL